MARRLETQTSGTLIDKAPPLAEMKSRCVLDNERTKHAFFLPYVRGNIMSLFTS